MLIYTAVHVGPATTCTARQQTANESTKREFEVSTIIERGNPLSPCCAGGAKRDVLWASSPTDTFCPRPSAFVPVAVAR